MVLEELQSGFGWKSSVILQMLLWINDENELDEIRQYIVLDPLKWALDEENPENWSPE
jgi:hypothetical protein